MSDFNDTGRRDLQRIKELEATIEKLRDYTEHCPTCNVHIHKSCDCGLAELLEK